MSLKLIVIYAAYGDALLLKTPDTPAKYWLIDGGPIRPHPALPSPDHKIPLNAYYQYLKRALHRYCSFNKDGVIDDLAGIIVTHPDGDHMDGINRLFQLKDISVPAKFKGPVLLNSLFYRLNDKEAGATKPFLYPLVRFLDEADNSSFGVSEVLQSDPDIPPNMKNESSAGLYKMVHGQPRNSGYPQPVDNYTWGNHDLDKSDENRSSIITMWFDPPAPGVNPTFDLVTTGDGLPSYILESMKRYTPNPQTIPAVGIFKVPHHGSEYNNQWSEDVKDYVSPGGAKQERNFFFCVATLAVRYNSLAGKWQNTPSNATMDALARWVLLHGPMEDWKAKTGATAAEFQTSIEELSDYFCAKLQSYQKPAKVGNQTFDLKNNVDMRRFADALVARYDNRKFQIIKSGYIAPRTLGADEVTISSFQDEGFRLQFQRVIGAKSASPQYFEPLFACLDSNALDELRRARFVQNFYSKFKAQNYVISGNRFPHGHPKHTVVAGLMSHLILSGQGTTDPPRILVTDGASIILDYVFDLVETLLSDHNSANPTNPLTPDKWKEKVRVYCLATDFLAEVPFDISDLDKSGVREIDFSAYASTNPDNEEYLTFLQNQFLKAKPYDMPRAAISKTSTFRITIRLSGPNQTSEYLDVDANGQPFFPAQGNPPLFRLIYIDHNSSNRNTWSKKDEPHFNLCKYPARNPLIYNLFFRWHRGADPNSDVYKDPDPVTGQMQRLYLNNQGVLSFKTVPDVGDTLATIQFERYSNFND